MGKRRRLKQSEVLYEVNKERQGADVGGVEYGSYPDDVDLALPANSTTAELPNCIDLMQRGKLEFNHTYQQSPPVTYSFALLTPLPVKLPSISSHSAIFVFFGSICGIKLLL
jgi:hypothetical protein